MEAALNGPYGRTILESPVVTLGRAPDNQVVIGDAKASAHHAELRSDGQGYSLVDLGSTNGTFVNDKLPVYKRNRSKQPGRGQAD